METVNINPVNTLNIRNVYTVHNKEPVYTHKTFAFPTEQQAEGQTNKSADISFSVEKDINVIITFFKDTNTKKVIQQIPSEEALKRIRFIKNYLASHTDQNV